MPIDRPSRLMGDFSRYDETHSMKRIRLLAVAASLLAAESALAQGRPVTPADQAAGDAWWAHIQALADDKNEGRLTGSEGYLRAAKYVVGQFDSAKLLPAGVNGYYQPVKFSVTRVLAAQCSMALVADGGKQPLVLGQDAILGARGTQPKSITAPLVFIGYGLHLPEAKYDDFDSADVTAHRAAVVAGGDRTVSQDGGAGLFLKSNRARAALALYKANGFRHAPRPGGPSHDQRAGVYLVYERDAHSQAAAKQRARRR